MKNSVLPLRIEVTHQWPDLTPKLTKEQFFALGFTQKDLDKGERRFETEHSGPWEILTKCRGMVLEHVSFEDAEKNYRGSYTHYYIFHGFRSLDKPKQSGYDLEGKISLNGKNIRAFTSSQLIDVEGKLVNLAILYPAYKWSK